MHRLPRRACLLTLIALLGLAPAAGAVQLKIATLAPEGSAWMSEVRRGADEIAQRTAGRVELRLYPGGSMGNDQAMLRKIGIGQLHGAMIVSSSLGTVTEDVQLYGLPLVFHSYAEVDHVRPTLDPVLVERLARKGLVSFGMIEGGFAYIMSSRPTSSLDDLVGRKAWIPEGDPIAKAVLDAAGLAPVPLPLSDVLTGLQTGLLDTVASPPVGAVALQWFTKARYLTDQPIVYSYGSIVISDKAFAKLDAADQATVREILARVSHTLDQRSRADNTSAREALLKQGVQVIAVSPTEQQRWHQVAAKANQLLAGGKSVAPALVAQLDQLLVAYRAQHGG